MFDINLIKRYIHLHDLQFPPGGGAFFVFCHILSHMVGAFVCFGSLFKANPHLYPGVGFTFTGALHVMHESIPGVTIPPPEHPREFV